MCTGTSCVSAELASPEAGLAAATPTCTLYTPGVTLLDVSVAWPVALFTVSDNPETAGDTLPLNVMAAPLVFTVGMLKLTESLDVAWSALIGRDRNGGSTVVSWATFTVNDCWDVAPVTLSVAVTVTVAVPVAPAGADSRSTPFCVSVYDVTLVIFTVLFGELSSPLVPVWTGTFSICCRTLDP
jgi:hypothetical protein